MAEFEISGAAKIEYSIYSSDGQPTGASQPVKTGDAMKTEPSLKLFINADVGEESAFHAELLLADDGEAPDGRLEGGESYTQYEVLREFYFDVPAAGWDFRIGKQQVVWGTADGIKLLDIINPTDFRELNQNVMEDARIPVLMVNAEKYFENGSSIQVIVSEAQPNIIAGLDATGEYGAPFIFKGVDTITGKTNGFLNIAPDLGQTSGIFQSLLSFGGLTGLTGGPMSTFTVNGFASLGTSRSPLTFNDVAGLLNPPSPSALTGTNAALFNQVFFGVLGSLGVNSGDQVLGAAANQGEALFGSFTNFLQTNLIPSALNVIAVPTYATATTQEQQTIDSANFLLQAMGITSPGGTANPGATPLDLQNDATRATFAGQFAALTPEQQQAAFNTPQVQQIAQAFGTGTTNQFDGELNVDNPQSAFEYMGNTTFGTFDAFVNMNTVYRRDYDTDPFSESNLGFRFRNTTEGGTNYSINYAYRWDSNPYVDIHWEDSAGTELFVEKTQSPDAFGNTVTTLNLAYANGTDFSSSNNNPQTPGANPATLVFEEKLNQINTIGMSFDTAVDGAGVPIVLRGEFSYDVATKQPVIDLDELSIGNLTGALRMEDADLFKYVLGVDVTVLTNMLVSTQLIQFYNLDYIDENNSRRYTGDFSSMHLSNGLKKGDEVETFISLFLSKPFGSDVQHRWNNILIFENDGGYWNRFDVEYSINNDLIGLVEVNSYWGDEDTMFGQFKDSSNLQLGLKYLF